jgi:hypothetical protein
MEIMEAIFCKRFEKFALVVSPLTIQTVGFYLK